MIDWLDDLNSMIEFEVDAIRARLRSQVCNSDEELDDE